MPNTIITFEHLAKSYLVGHKLGGLRPGTLSATSSYAKVLRGVGELV